MVTLNNRNKNGNKNRSFHAENIGSTKFSGRQEKQEGLVCAAVCVCVCVRRRH